jgi:hypothetical protein
MNKPIRLGKSFDCPKCGMIHKPLLKCPSNKLQKPIKNISIQELKKMMNNETNNNR